jgi:predicted  nucleic acid-binding Zn-ribbon protein
MSLKTDLLNKLVEVSGRAAFAGKLEDELKVANAQLRVNENYITKLQETVKGLEGFRDELTKKNTDMESSLKSLHDAADTAMKKLTVNTPERKELSLAIIDAERFVDNIPF